MESEWIIRSYSPEDVRLWDSFVATSRQGTLLHFRGYMDYHSDRFQDCSLIAYKRGKPTALLPANLTKDGILISHQGLTYGSWLTPMSHFDGSDMLALFEVWREWCISHDIKEIIYKTVPHIYHKASAEEDLYALFRSGAQIDTVNLSSVVDLHDTLRFNTQQKRNLKKAGMLSPLIRETANAAEFMPILTECLRERHNVAPVHSESELQLLKDRFPENIRFFIAGINREPEAAVCVYDTNGVAHCQYIATSREGRENGTLTYLMHHLMTKVYADNRYFDFGTSTEDAGMILNSGLLHQKTGLGGRGVGYCIYIIHL